MRQWNLGEEKGQKGEQLREPKLQWISPSVPPGPESGWAAMPQCQGGSGSSWGLVPTLCPSLGDGGKGWRRRKTRRKSTARRRRRRRDLWEVSKCLPALESSVTRQWVLGCVGGRSTSLPSPPPSHALPGFLECISTASAARRGLLENNFYEFFGKRLENPLQHRAPLTCTPTCVLPRAARGL